MATWLHDAFHRRMKGDQLKVYQIPNGWVTPRPGVVLFHWAANDAAIHVHIIADGSWVARHQTGYNYGGTINAFVPQGTNVSFGWEGGVSSVDFHFMEF